MARWERFSQRDLAYSKWHRHLGNDVTFVDIDAVEYCNKCMSPLAIMELAQDVEQPNKPFMLTLRMARACNVPGYVVLYTADETKEEKDTIVRMRVMKIYPEISGFNEVSGKDFGAWLKSLHDNCPCLHNDG